MSRRQQIGSALDTLLANPVAESPSKQPALTPSKPQRGEQAAAFTVQVDRRLLEQLRDLVAYRSGPPHHLTLRAVVEHALHAELEHELRQARDAGEVGPHEPFPPRAGNLRVGRPIVPAASRRPIG